jgi:hypothetical protein
MAMSANNALGGKGIQAVVSQFVILQEIAWNE